MKEPHLPDTSGRRREEDRNTDFEENIKKLAMGAFTDEGQCEQPDEERQADVESDKVRGYNIPVADSSPMITNTNQFCNRMQDAADYLARQMDQRAFVLEKKAEELRSRASKLKHYSSSLNQDLKSFSELLTEYHNDVQSLALVEPKDTETER